MCPVTELGIGCTQFTPVARGYPCQACSGVVTLDRMGGRGVPLWDRTEGLPHGQDGSTPPPPAGYKLATGGTPLAVTQEDFLVHLIFC